MNELNFRESNMKKKMFFLGTIAIFICCLSIAYAVLSTTLTISGSGKVSSSSWDIGIYYNYTDKVGTATYTTPTIVDNRIGNYSVGLAKPGDSVTIYFDIYNDGDIYGEISSIYNSTPICTSDTGNTADENLICDNLEFEFFYTNGDEISVGDVLNTDSMYCLNGENTAFDTAGVGIRISLKSSMSAVPSSTVTVSNLNHEIIYSQSDKECNTYETCFVEGTKVLTNDGYKNIEEIRVGDYVYAMNLDTNTKELREVKKTHKNKAFETYLITVGSHLVETTRKHQFYVIDKGWVRAGDLVVGDRLSSIKDVDTTISNIKRKTYKDSIYVYNLEIEEFHNYLITDDDYLVHNGNTSYIPI